MSNSRTRKARIQAKASGQSYQKCLESCEPTEATAAQRELEGAFFNKLRSLRYAPRGFNPSAYGIVHVEPRSESLTIHFGEATPLQEVIGYVLPVSEDSADPASEVWGVPGLRMRPHKAGTCLYRPGQPGEIVIAGVGPESLAPTSGGPASWAGRAAPDEWTHHEQLHVKKHGKGIAGGDIESAILRRIGLLTATDAYSIESWRSRPSRLVVELLFEQLSPEQAQSVPHEMTSIHLAPCLHLLEYRPSRTEHGGGAFDLFLPTTGETAQVRLVISPRITNGGERPRTLHDWVRSASTSGGCGVKPSRKRPKETDREGRISPSRRPVSVTPEDRLVEIAAGRCQIRVNRSPRQQAPDWIIPRSKERPE